MYFIPFEEALKGGSGNHQLFRCSLLDDGSTVEDDDAIDIGDGGDAVGDDQGGTIFHQARQRIADLPIGCEIEMRHPLVEDQQLWIAHQRSGDPHPLTLACRQLFTPFAHHRFQPCGRILARGRTEGRR